MALNPAAWKAIRNIIQSLLVENSELDRNAVIKEKYEFDLCVLDFNLFRFFLLLYF